MKQKMKVKLKSQGATFMFSINVDMTWNRKQFRRFLKRDVQKISPHCDVRGTPIIKIYNSPMKKQVCNKTNL